MPFVKVTISGCEDYYNPAAKKKKEELASSLGADLSSSDFSMFIKLLKNSGVLKGGNLLKAEKPIGGGLGGRPGRLGGRPRRPGGRPGGRRGGRPRGGPRRGPGSRRPRPLRPQIPTYDYYDYVDYQEADSPETPAESQSFAQAPVGRRARPQAAQVIIAATLNSALCSPCFSSNVLGAAR